MAFKSSRGRSLGKLLKNYKTSTLGLGFGSGASFSFKYYAYGAQIGDLELYFDTGAAPLNGPLSFDPGLGTGTVTTLSGQQHSSEGLPWNVASCDLTAYVGQTGYIVFKYQSVDYLGDFQIDAMELTLSNGTVVDLDPNTYNSATAKYGYEENWVTPNVDSSNYPISSSDHELDYYATSSWVPVGTTGNLGFWSADNGPTGTVGTGDPTDSDGSSIGYFIYTEVSSSPLEIFWLKTASQYTL